MCYRASVCLFARLYVSNFTRRTTDGIFVKILPENVSVDKEELIFWKSSASGSGSRNVLKDSATLRDSQGVHNLAISLEKYRSDLNEYFMTDVSLDKEVHVKLWMLSGPGLKNRTGFTLAKVCVLRVRLLLFTLDFEHWTLVENTRSILPAA